MGAGSSFGPETAWCWRAKSTRGVVREADLGEGILAFRRRVAAHGGGEVKPVPTKEFRARSVDPSVREHRLRAATGSPPSHGQAEALHFFPWLPASRVESSEPLVAPASAGRVAASA